MTTPSHTTVSNIAPSPAERSSPVHTEAADYDVVVVGASFAGLSFAGGAAARGLRTLVLERDAEVGRVVRTTGVLFSDVLDVLDVPERYLMNAVRRIRLRPPNHEPIEISAAAHRFYMADVTGLLRWMAEQAQAHGAELRAGAPFLDAAPEAGGQRLRVTFGADGARAPGNSVTARYLIGADGARSRVAQVMGLDTNTHLLAGAEWLVEGATIPRDTFHLVMDHALAPGYCVWLAPHGDELAAFGVAGHLRAFSPSETLRIAQGAFADVADLSGLRVVERKAGVIPVGGRQKRVHRDDARGRALLLGDAAGLCGAATGGGIYPALISGRLAAHAVANAVLNDVPGAVPAYLANLSQAGRLGHYLKIEDWLRWVLDRMASNADLSVFYGLLGTAEGRAVLQRTLLETPIVNMDSGFFGMLRSLLSHHPRVYGSVFRGALRRVTARA